MEVVDSEGETGGSEASGEAARLEAAMPRALIESGQAANIAREWVRRSRAAARAGRPALSRYALDRGLRDVLFELRRARRVVRGLEAAAEALDREAAGLDRTPAAQPQGRRISRLLVLSDDGAGRFYRDADRLVERHASRLAAIVVEADETELGEAVFGGGRRARAILIDHKEGVVLLLSRLAGEAPPDEPS